MFSMPTLRVGDAIAHRRLTIYPLYPTVDDSPTPGYRLADEALADGTAVVEEVSDGGSVPNLAVTSTAGCPVLFLEGEELRGAKQNRVLNTSVLVPAGVKTVIPVSCVEQGRWRYTSPTFAPSGATASFKLRSVLKASSSRSARAGRGHTSDQSSVWAEVGRQMTAHGASSATAAMSDTFTAQQATVDDYRERIAYPDGAIGFAAAVGGRVVSVDVFDTGGTCAKVWDRLLTGLVMDAVEAGDDAGDPDVAGVLGLFGTDAWTAVPAAGTGEEYRAEPADGSWQASALTHDGRLVHGSWVAVGE